MSLLSVQNLSVRFPSPGGASVRAVDDVGFTLASGETLGIVGESGCGKTTLGRAIVRLLKPMAGKVLFDGKDLCHVEGRQLRELRRQFQMVFQDPYGSLDPQMTIEQTLLEPLAIHRLASHGRTHRERVAELLHAVGLDAAHAQRYPHELSGGQRQRIGIARALVVEPKMIVCDEPVSALDVSVQAQVVNLLQDLQQQRGLAYLFISHDLAVVEHISHRVLVMYLGKIMELAPAKAIARTPRHPYTQALISAVPATDPATQRQHLVLPGEVPSPIHPPPGCAFHTRCPLAQERCRTEVPPLRSVSGDSWVACHLAE